MRRCHLKRAAGVSRIARRPRARSPPDSIGGRGGPPSKVSGRWRSRFPICAPQTAPLEGGTPCPRWPAGGRASPRAADAPMQPQEVRGRLENRSASPCRARPQAASADTEVRPPGFPVAGARDSPSVPPPKPRHWRVELLARLGRREGARPRVPPMSPATPSGPRAFRESHGVRVPRAASGSQAASADGEMLPPGRDQSTKRAARAGPPSVKWCSSGLLSWAPIRGRTAGCARRGSCRTGRARDCGARRHRLSRRNRDRRGGGPPGR